TLGLEAGGVAAVDDAECLGRAAARVVALARLLHEVVRVARDADAGHRRAVGVGIHEGERTTGVAAAATVARRIAVIAALRADGRERDVGAGRDGARREGGDCALSGADAEVDLVP